MDTMDFRLIDSVMPFQLEIGDFIRVNDFIVPIVDIAEGNNSYTLFYLDEFEEKDFIEINDDQNVGIYIID